MSAQNIKLAEQTFMRLPGFDSWMYMAVFDADEVRDESIIGFDDEDPLA